ncbi:MAG: ABC transporter substrate-binding protein, partial [Oscillospiraceae bacterium]|nr:ABC transporter substrate-binding protein [Oscillospiraceae bacterium]
SMAANVKAVYVPSDNTVAQNDTIVGTICGENKVPVYTSYGGAVCYASLAISYYDLGYETGVMAAQILLGNKTPADYEIATLTPTVTYNEELCAQLGIEVPEN